MNNTFYTNYPLLNCTKEVIYCLEKARKLAILTDSSLTLKPIHLCLSLIFNSKLIQKILNIKYSKLNEKNILNIVFDKKISNGKEKKIENLINIDKDILTILSILSGLEYPFNTLSLFYYLWKQNISLFRFILLLFNVEENNNKYFTIMKSCLEEPLPKINIPIILEKILNLIKKNNNIIGREEETENIIEILNRNLNRNVVLIGNEGIGKTSVIQKVVSSMPNRIFLNLNIRNLISYKDNMDIINELFNFLKLHENIIIYCKNFHLLFDCSKTDLTFIKNSLLDILYVNKIQLIGTTLSSYYDKIVEEDEQLKFLFSKISIKEPNKYIILLIMKQYLRFNNIHWINDNILEFIIKLSEKFIKTYVFPKKALLILDSIVHKYKKNVRKGITNRDLLITISQYSELPSTLILKENANINNIDLDLKKYVFGQDIAISKISASLKRTYIGLKDKNKPIGSWLLCGPSGTGKTELVKSLAFLLFGSEKELIRFDMSEFMEKHSISKLIGSPPGYVGCDEGGLLTEAVKKKPYSVVLFDEIEKAHKDINNIMLQLLDEGFLTDSKGQNVDFSNTLIIYTSNLGCTASSLQFESLKNEEELLEEEYKFLSKNVNEAVKKFFKPELLNRLDSIIVFKPLSIMCLKTIIDKFIFKLEKKLQENNILLKIEIEPEIKDLLAKIAYNPLYGARPLKRIIEQFIEKPISELIINLVPQKPYLFSIFESDEKKNTIGYLVQKIRKKNEQT